MDNLHTEQYYASGRLKSHGKNNAIRIEQCSNSLRVYYDIIPRMLRFSKKKKKISI